MVSAFHQGLLISGLVEQSEYEILLVNIEHLERLLDALTAPGDDDGHQVAFDELVVESGLLLLAELVVDHLGLDQDIDPCPTFFIAELDHYLLGRLHFTLSRPGADRVNFFSPSDIVRMVAARLGVRMPKGLSVGPRRVSLRLGQQFVVALVCFRCQGFVGPSTGPQQADERYHRHSESSSEHADSLLT